MHMETLSESTRVRNRLLVLLVGVSGVCLGGGLLSYATSNGVLVQVSRVNAGTAKIGAELTTSIRVINLSGSDVLMSTFPTCGCTTTPLTQKRLLPLHAAAFPVSIDTSGMTPGPKIKRVIVYFEAGRRRWRQAAEIRFALR